MSHRNQTPPTTANGSDASVAGFVLSPDYPQGRAITFVVAGADMVTSPAQLRTDRSGDLRLRAMQQRYLDPDPLDVTIDFASATDFVGVAVQLE